MVCSALRTGRSDPRLAGLKSGPIIAILSLLAMGAEEPVDPPLPRERPQAAPQVNEEDKALPDSQDNSEQESSGNASDDDAPGDDSDVESDAGPAELNDTEEDEEPDDDDAQQQDTPRIVEDPEELAACFAELKAIGTTYSKLPAIPGDGSCGITDPVSVTKIVPGVELLPDSKLRCRTALALARWTRDFVVPATKVLGENVRLTAIQHASTYICRRRNNRPDGKLSQHSFGNAIDIGSFSVAGHDAIFIEARADTGTAEEAFQRAVRGSACLNYTTVIGPGTDQSHADHLHFDIIERNGGYRLCQ